MDSMKQSCVCDILSALHLGKARCVVQYGIDIQANRQDVCMVHCILGLSYIILPMVMAFWQSRLL